MPLCIRMGSKYVLYTLTTPPQIGILPLISNVRTAKHQPLLDVICYVNVDNRFALSPRLIINTGKLKEPERMRGNCNEKSAANHCW